MQIRDIFTVTKGTKVVLAITFLISLLIFISVYFYYQGINQSEDPRVQHARELLSDFDEARVNDLSSLAILDSAAAIYQAFPEYAHSYEMGVLYNNKATVLIMKALYDSVLMEGEKETLLSIASQFCDSSISVYRHWMLEWDSLDHPALLAKHTASWNTAGSSLAGSNPRKVLNKRLKDLQTAQIETPRRLSVSLTNKGTIYRHQLKTDSALICFEEALRLWKHNRAAKSNLNVLTGGEPVKPSVIETLFPPDKKKR